MKTKYHVIPFTHKCGREGTILEVAIRCDGVVALGGLCAICGETFTEEHGVAELLVSAAIADYKTQMVVSVEESLANFVPVGKPC